MYRKYRVPYESDDPKSDYLCEGFRQASRRMSARTAHSQWPQNGESMNSFGRIDGLYTPRVIALDLDDTWLNTYICFLYCLSIYYLLLNRYHNYVLPKGVDLGIWLRERYVHKFGLVPPHFDPSLVSLRTTCIQRTILTLQGVLTGFFPDLQVVIQFQAEVIRIDLTFPAARYPLYVIHLQGSVSVNASLERFEFEYGHRTCAALGSILDEVSTRSLSLCSPGIHS